MTLSAMALATQMRVASFYASAEGLTYLRIATEGSSYGNDQATINALMEALPAVPHVAQVATTFAVSADIGEQMAKASTSIPWFSFALEDLPTPEGFVVFEENVVISDGMDKPIAVKAFAWAPCAWKSPSRSAASNGVLFMLYTDPLDPRDSLHEMTVDPEKWKRRIGDLPIFMWGGAVSFGEHEEVVPNCLARLFMTFLRFIQEPWIEAVEESPGRQLARQSQRRGGSSTVKVVRLRKREVDRPKSDHHAPVEWSHQWVVEGHWRNQWYPSQGRHAPRWVRRHIKGPEDKPLVVKPKVFQVDR